jgi:hypothetical protein
MARMPSSRRRMREIGRDTSRTPTAFAAHRGTAPAFAEALVLFVQKVSGRRRRGVDREPGDQPHEMLDPAGGAAYGTGAVVGAAARAGAAANLS